MPMETFRPTKVRIAFASALVVLSAAGILLSWDVSRAQRTAQRVWDAQAVVERLTDIVTLFRDSVSASRGYAPDAVQLHRQSVESLQAALRDVRQGTKDSREQQQRISSLEAILARAIALERRRLEVVAQKGVQAADPVFREGHGEMLDDQIRRLVYEMKSEEDSLLRRHKAELDRGARKAQNVFYASVVLGFVILFAVYYYLEREIGRRQGSERRLIHLNRLYAFLSQANQVIVRARTRNELFREICRVAVEHGQFIMAWIGTPDAAGVIQPMARWGKDDGYLQIARTAHTIEDPRAAVLPIRFQDRPYGFLGVYAAQPGFFDDETLRLLEEVTTDISFALHTHDQEEQRQNAEQEIRRLNQALEERVLERTSQLGEANSLLAKQNEELARASRMKSEFLARMSHEFRTPLNSIIGFTDLLSEEGEGPLGESYADYVRHVHEGAHHLLALVNDILDLSRIEAGRIDLRHEEFAAAQAISEVLAVIAPLAEARKTDLRSEVAAALVVYGDRTRFKQILYNLLSNAVKFTPAGGSVQVTAESDYGEIRFRVSDTGIGIPPEQLATIFEEFTQVAAATTGVKEGAGLGLAITKRIVELHGGRIWVESTVEEGSRFFFTMPAARAGEHAATERWFSTA